MVSQQRVERSQGRHKGVATNHGGGHREDEVDRMDAEARMLQPVSFSAPYLLQKRRAINPFLIMKAHRTSPLQQPAKTLLTKRLLSLTLVALPPSWPRAS